MNLRIDHLFSYHFEIDPKPKACTLQSPFHELSHKVSMYEEFCRIFHEIFQLESCFTKHDKVTLLYGGATYPQTF